MGSDASFDVELVQQKTGLLKDQFQLVKRKDCDRYELVPFPGDLSFAKGFFVVIRAIQLLAEKNEGLILIGLAGPSGSGKTNLAEKILNFIPDVALISMDNYNDASRIVDGNFDDPRLTDYETLLNNIHDLRAGRHADVPIYDYKTSSRIGYRKVEVPSSRVVIIEGIYALSEKLRPLLDLRVSITGGIHFDLVKRVLRDVKRAGQQPHEIIHQISETVYPMYKAFIEPDLQFAHIRIINKFNPFTGLLSPTYILKSQKNVPAETIKSVMSETHTENWEQTYDMYLLPPGEDAETCHSYLRMRNKDGKYKLMFEEWVTDHPFVISPRITFEVSVRLLGGLMALGYSIASILKRRSHVFCDDKVCVKVDWLEQLNRPYIQVQGRDRFVVKRVAEQMGLEGSYIPCTYIEQIQIGKADNEDVELPDDIKTKLSLMDELLLCPEETTSRTFPIKNYRSGLSQSYSTDMDKHMPNMDFCFENGRRSAPESLLPDSLSTLSYQRSLEQLSDVISKLTNKMDNITLQMEELSNNLTNDGSSPTLLDETLLLTSPYFKNGESPTRNRVPTSLPSAQLPKGSSLGQNLSTVIQGHCQVTNQVENICNLVHEELEGKKNSGTKHENIVDLVVDRVNSCPILISLAFGGLGLVFLLRCSSSKS